MNVLAYVIAVLNPLLLNSRDVVFRVGPLHSLATEISQLPDFPQDAFKDNGYYRIPNKGVYVSKGLQNFIYKGIGDREEEGFILTLDFSVSKLDPPNDPEPIAYLLHRPEVDDDEKILVDQYIRSLKSTRRSSRKPKS